MNIFRFYFVAAKIVNIFEYIAYDIYYGLKIGRDGDVRSRAAQRKDQ